MRITYYKNGMQIEEERPFNLIFAVFREIEVAHVTPEQHGGGYCIRLYVNGNSLPALRFKTKAEAVHAYNEFLTKYNEWSGK